MSMEMKSTSKSGAAAPPAQAKNGILETGLTAKEVLIGPDEASRLLALGGQNRVPSNPWVKELARRMTEKRFEFNPVDAIAVDRNGNLINGQHRLMAIIASGTTQRFMLVEGANSSAFRVMDGGRRRGGGDTLSVIGVKNTHLTAAALQWIYRSEMAKARVESGEGRYWLSRSAGCDNETLIELYYKHIAITESTCVVDMLSPKLMLTPSLAVWLHYQFSQVDRERTNQFFEAVGQGKDLPGDCPEYALRQYLLNNITQSRKRDETREAAIVIKAWNRVGTVVKILKWLDNEEFPEIAGLSK